ncbi:uncharacterized protein TRIADDRAFT_56702 [Trichoplax adhaerens]|uniref:Uncharacterized protein n=1 Tax=Trichoplax adhaerens TaxID=10228 RepID=B3RWC5_TRIAD|nr:hypothetical protein TRIADDRAFT_56702 [Trichoplax adhaerens]EDV25110.1 hypothetical protein TRIADDRAFT_56702 [Trichoplax adhaerens]|eukprot:XP_002113000.1 hypothetical protein TRIADDRAFT_56702 [Trichoplax adhaerens]
MNANDQTAANRLYDVEVKTDPFAIVVKRRSTNTIIFDSSVSGFIYEDQFLEISSKLPSKYFYGLGEHEHRSFVHKNWDWKRWGMFARDEFLGPDKNLYSTHPMYLNIEDNAGNSNVVLLANSNAMEVVLTPLPGITWRTIGGILDFYIFLGPSPADAVSQYIKDAQIGNNETNGTYPPYDEGMQRNIFIRHSDDRMIVGKVWPRGTSVFPDFTSDSTKTWWRNMIVDFRRTIPFDGLWLDMNEPANFVPGLIVGCINNQYNYPPYKPKAIIGKTLFNQTICMDGKQAWGSHYNTHSLYGYSEIEPSLQGCNTATGKRSIMISRSTFAGSGSLEFNLFGIPFVGADICGLFGNATASLCNRWMQLGAFYPFARNHNTRGNSPQHSTAFDTQNAVNARKVLLIRYRLLPYLYTLFYEAATEGKTVMRSLMMEFPTDLITCSIYKQFMWGSALLITPILEDNANSVYGYFPSGRWFDYYTGVELKTKGNVSLNAPADYIPLHMRGGSIMVVQEPANTTVYSRKNKFTIIIAISANNYAEGSFFWDDGESIDTIKNNQYTYMTMKATKDTLTVNMVKNDYAIEPTVSNILVYGITVPYIVSVTVGGEFKNHVFNSNTRVKRGININMVVKRISNPYL